MGCWTGVEEFVAVVESGSFSAAAKSLNVSKGYVSQQITKLEERLGAQLLHRTTRQVSPSENGKIYYQQCHEIMRQLKEAESSITDQLDKPKGVLKISTVGGVFGERYVAPVAAEFMRKYPEIELRLNFSSERIDLVKDSIDLAIRSGTLSEPGIKARQLISFQNYICGSPDYFKQHGVPEKPQDLKQHHCIMGSAPWKFQESAGPIEIKKESRWWSNNGQAMIAAALAGLGLIRLPDFYVKELVQQGKLQYVLNEYAEIGSGMWVVYPENRYLATKVRLFIDFLIEKMTAPL